jgi:ABC-type polysaccharide/polyol phosphate transport system ATPase subunit
VIAYLDHKVPLIDNIFAAGDMEFQIKCLAKMTELKQMVVTRVAVSPSRDVIERIFDRLICVEDLLNRHKATCEAP